MSLDIIGPANAPNATTIRPADTRDGAFGSVDTWMKDCSSSAANDGTKLQAGLFNAILGQLRNLIRGNGLTGASADVVAQDNSDDTMLLKAVQHLIQRGQPTWTTDTSVTPNIVTVSVSPAPAEYKAGMALRIKMANVPTGASVVNLNGLGNKSIVKGGSLPLTGGEWAVGDVVVMTYDGVSFQVSSIAAGVVQKLTANKDLYVNASTGSDSLYDGTASTVSGSHGPFLTIQKAVDTAFTYAPSQYTITVHVAAGTYTAGGKTPLYPGNTLTISGAGSGSTFVNVTSDYGFLVQGPNVMNVNNLRVNSTVAALGQASFGAGNGGNMSTSNTASGASNSAIFIATSGASMQVGNHTFNGNSAALWWSTFNANISLINASFTFAAPITVSVATAWASALGTIGTSSGAPTTFNSPGNVTGPKYLAASNGYINADGQGINFFPGSSAGSTSVGGQYA